PDNLLKDVMSGNKNVDIHDVMTAMAKSEISVNIATQITGKVINAYDRVMQISV
ncbi:TPA: flagellar hook-basal body complex protein FliE, partial [Candidatus Gastranaerophilales bacterium HUM_14]